MSPVAAAILLAAITLSEPRWVVPSEGLPPEARPLASNNNCAIEMHEGRLFLAWRTAPTHFASARTRIVVVSSANLGETWDFEREVAVGADVREPAFIAIGGRLVFQWFEAGSDPLAFEPRRLWRSVRTAAGRWSEPEAWGEPGEIVWDVKVRGGRAWMTSYRGAHYDLTDPDAAIEVRFQVSGDGLSWAAVDAARGPVVHRGGVSEVAFEFAEDGSLRAVGRNEDGDATGFGSLLGRAPAGAPGTWTWSARSDPERYDSPEMFRHGKDIYLVARRDLGGPFDRAASGLRFDRRRLVNMVAYSLRPKRTALYRFDDQGGIVWLKDLPSAGDTAFASVCKVGKGRYLLANYTSPPDAGADWSWVRGQLSRTGTRIYLQEIVFAAD